MRDRPAGLNRPEAYNAVDGEMLDELETFGVVSMIYTMIIMRCG